MAADGRELGLMLATTTVSILGGVIPDDGFGDPADNSTVSASGIPASIIERARQSTGYRDGIPRVVRTVDCRLPAGTVVTEDSRIRDENTGQIYIIDSIAKPAFYVGIGGLKLALTRT